MDADDIGIWMELHLENPNLTDTLMTKLDLRRVVVRNW